MVPVSKQTRRPVLVVDDDEDEKTRVYTGSLPDHLDSMSGRWLDEIPDEPWPEAKPGFALSRTLRPLAAGLRSFPLAYALSILALVMSGAAWYMSRSGPTDAAQTPAAAAKPSEPLAAAPPITKPSRDDRPITKPSAPAAEIAPVASVVATKPPMETTKQKRPIDVMSLPIAPPAKPTPSPRPTR